MSNFEVRRRVVIGLCATLGLTPALAAETVALAGTATPGPRVIVSSEPVMQVVVGGALNHPVLAAVVLVVAIALFLFLLRQRHADRDAPDQPEPPAVPSAWPKSFKPQAAAGHFPARKVAAAAPGENRAPATTKKAAAMAGAVAAETAAAAPAKASLDFEWPGAANDELPVGESVSASPRATTPARTAAAPSSPAQSADRAQRPAIALSSLQLRLRDRYISVRFSGVAKSSQDLEASGQVIKAARLYFEDDQARRAVELLELAIEQHPEAESLWLALIEILFLVRMRKEFCKVAARYKVQHPASPQWAEVARLGAVIAGDNLMFRAAAGSPRAHEHYGPWPDLPNWIQAPWDLTAEVSAADFHARMNQRLAARRVASTPVAALAKAA
ncbi:MAG: hypothetical protein SF172_06090 [Burkholderiales bacterium]|nr:hypothetical protein [Burkholderiales bacterium]